MACLLLSAAGALAAHWTVNPHEYRYDMTVYAVLQVNGTTVTDYTDYEVAAFSNAQDSPIGYECRGVAKVLTATDGTKLLYLRVYSNVTTSESITFRVYRPSTGEETELEEKADFETEAVIGTPGEPMLLSLSSAVKGNVNGDGSVDAQDASLVLQYVAKKISTIQNADVNNDGSIDAQDASLILQYVAKKITW